MLKSRVTQKFVASFTIFSMLFLHGCLRVNTDPQTVFAEVQQDVLTRTGHTACWDTCPDEAAFKSCIESTLKQELTEDLVVYIALLNNRQLQATYENLGIAKAQLVQAGLLRNPIFALSYRFSTKSTVTDLIDIGLFQNFLEALLIPLKKRMAASELEATQAMVTTQILDVIAQTKIAFCDFQALEQIWTLKKQVLLGAESSYDAARRLFEAGNIKDLELTANRTFYEQTKVELASLEVTVLKSRERLNVLMGLWGNQINWKASICLPIALENESDWGDIESCAIANSLDLTIARRQIYATAAGFGIDTTRIVFPQMEIGPSSERDEGVWFVGPAIALGIPLFDFGQAVSAAAQAEILRQWNRFTALAVDIRSTARIARIHVLNTHRQSQYFQKILVPLAEQLTSLTLLQHNAMQLGVFHLLSAKLQELEKKIQAVEHLRDYWTARTELEMILNGHIMQKNTFEISMKK